MKQQLCFPIETELKIPEELRPEFGQLRSAVRFDPQCLL